MDHFEKADHETQDYIDDCIQRVRDNPPKKLKPKGECYRCQEPVNEIQLFCNGDCARKYDLLGPE